MPELQAVVAAAGVQELPLLRFTRTYDAATAVAPITTATVNKAVVRIFYSSTNVASARLCASLAACRLISPLLLRT